MVSAPAKPRPLCHECRKPIEYGEYFFWEYGTDLYVHVCCYRDPALTSIAFDHPDAEAAEQAEEAG